MAAVSNHSMRRAILAAALVACAWAHHAHSEPIESSRSAEEWLRSLSEVETAIATRTKMNADYVPGMVTVLHGKDLEAKGARTVWEALALVPGVELAIEKTGRRKVLMRGFDNTFNSGSVKILLNDVSMNSAFLGMADPVMNIPVEQVARIEVIRGPGAALYGEYAYLGVINVVTHSEDSKIFSFGGSFDSKGLGAVVCLTDPENPWQASLNLAAWKSSGADAKLTTDRLYQYGDAAASFSYAPAKANEEIEAGNAIFKLGYERFALTAQWSEDGFGDHFGINWYLPPDSNRVVEHWRHRSVTGRQEFELTPSLTAGVQLDWKDVEQRRDHQFIRRNYFVLNGPDIFLQSHYLERAVGLQTDTSYHGWDKHTVLLAASRDEVRVDDNPITFTPPLNDPVITASPGTTRRDSALMVQDEYRQSDRFTLTTGLRYDDYSDVGNRTSPRIAGVWRLDNRHILKAQYGEAFRPPTFYELASATFFGWDAPEPATIQTSELGYIYKGENVESRITAFYSRLDGLVVWVYPSDPTKIFGNGSATAKGVELEQRWWLDRQWTLDGNISYVDTRGDETGKPFPGVDPWLANAGITYEKGNFVGALQAHYVSGYGRQPNDPRDTLSGYTTVDLTGSFACGPDGLQFRLGIKNLFDADIRYPAPIVQDKLTYAEDFPRAGRSGWAQVTFRY